MLGSIAHKAQAMLGCTLRGLWPCVEVSMMRRSPSLFAYLFAALFMLLLANRAWCDPAGSFIRVLPGHQPQLGTPVGASAGYNGCPGGCPVPRQLLRPPTVARERGRRSRAGAGRAAREFDRATGRDRASESPSTIDRGTTGSEGANAGAGATSTGLDLSGGAGASSINGSVAGSPSIRADALGLSSGLALGGGIGFNLGSGVQIRAEFGRFSFKSSSNYTGPDIQQYGYPYLYTGDPVETHFILSTTGVCASADIASFLSGSVGSAFCLGPEVGWLYYQSDLQITNYLPGGGRLAVGSMDASRHSMYTAGGLPA